MAWSLVPVIGLRNLSAVVLSPISVYLTWVAPCHTQQYHIYYRGTCGTCGTYVDEGRLDTDHQEHKFGELQEGINYSSLSGFSRGRVLSIGPVYARTCMENNTHLLPQKQGWSGVYKFNIQYSAIEWSRSMVQCTRVQYSQVEPWKKQVGCFNHTVITLQAERLKRQYNY